jgi:hypothetical protein
MKNEGIQFGRGANGIALGGSGGLKDCGDIENGWVENDLAACIISELYDLTHRIS